MTINSTISARVVTNKPLSAQGGSASGGQKSKTCKYFRMALALDKPVKKVVPGQFIHIRLDSDNHILPRPFTIYDVKNRGRVIEVVYQVVGQGTELMSHLNPGSRVKVLCPLGNGFRIDKKVHPVRKTSNGDKDIAQFSKHNRELSNGARMHILVAGGIGLAGLYLLLKQLMAQRIKNTYIFIGARSKDDLCLLPEFQKLNQYIVVTTEDGTSGAKGFITTALENFLEKLDIRHLKLDISLYTCGPTGMSQAVRQIAVAKNIPCQLSLEARMACGVGLCRVCVCKTIKGYGTVCEDGPVFEANDLTPSARPPRMLSGGT